MGNHSALVPGERWMQRHICNFYFWWAFLQDNFTIFPMAKSFTVIQKQRVFQRAGMDPTCFCMLKEKKICWYHTKNHFIRDFPGGTVVKNPPANAGDMGSIPGPGRSHMLQSNWTCAPQLLSLRSRAREPQLLSPHATTVEARTLRACAPQQEEPPQWEARTPQQRVAPTRLLQLERALVWRRGPNAEKNKLIN